ncbi:periplasmic chaperone for outer membrane proteins Skp [Pontibacter lucknowensis]|uniref:Periplasmic chaperone for outer membrane proteins Skp n=1 Tax=Pontibacter lucknowensis TaxID=1077936 RepID=A0A1N6X3Y5_9BACT|nr:periplasmic chaperone for outer membrane proteins Skp [Pontibacter lucknowensis]
MGALLTACNTDQKPQATVTSTTSANSSDTLATAAVADIVYINSDSLLSNYEYFKDARTRFQSKTQKAEKDLQAKAAAFEKDVQNYQRTGGNMTVEQRASTEQKLSQRQQQLQQQSQTTGNQLATEEAEEMKKIYDRVEAYLQKLSQERGYKMVLTYSRGQSAILYGDNSLDITQEVLAGLNSEYDQEKTAASTKEPAAKKK